MRNVFSTKKIFHHKFFIQICQDVQSSTERDDCTIVFTVDLVFCVDKSLWIVANLIRSHDFFPHHKWVIIRRLANSRHAFIWLFLSDGIFCVILLFKSVTHSILHIVDQGNFNLFYIRDMKHKTNFLWDANTKFVLSSLSPCLVTPMLQIAIKHLKVSLFARFLRGVAFLCPCKMQFFSAHFTATVPPLSTSLVWF